MTTQIRNRLLRLALGASFFATAIAASPAQAAPERVAIAFVPGTFSAWSTSTFSPDIVASLALSGNPVHVIEGLTPAGHLEENGRRAALDLHRWYASLGERLPIVLVGHSAGGLYALHAIALSPDLPFRGLITVSTPWQGTELSDRAFADPRFGRMLAEFIERAAPVLDLRGLVDLTTGLTADFVGRHVVPAGLRIFSIVSHEESPPFYAPWWDTRYLAPPLRITAHFIGKSSDGVISVESATGAGVHLRDARGGLIPVRNLPELQLHLDHPSAVLAARSLSHVGALHVEFVQSEQRRVYTALGRLASNLAD